MVLHGNANKLGNKNASEYVVKGDFAILTGTITSATSGSHIINFPAGFNKDNCVLISKMFQNTQKTEGISEGSAFDSSNMFWGGLTSKITFKDNITVTLKNFLISGNSVSEVEITQNFNYKIVIMKV